MKRLTYIDIAKGISILLVIIGHTLAINNSFNEHIMRGIIFSFHMPLFFIVSNMTFKHSETTDIFIKKTKKAAHHLLVPALNIFLIRLLVNIYTNRITISNFHFFKEKILSLIFSSGVDVHINNFTIPAFGMMWFLIALFLGRTIHDYLHLKLSHQILTIVSIFCGVIGIVLPQVLWLPLSLDIVLAIQPFFLISPWIRNHFEKKQNVFNTLLLSLILWSGTLIMIYFTNHSYLELVKRNYPLFPVSYICAIAGTITVLSISKLIEDYKISKPLIILGRYSIILFGIHSMDYLLNSIWSIPNNVLLSIIVRLFLNILTFIIIYKHTKKSEE